jgi:tryptophanyl-tRNA synthetase
MADRYRRGGSGYGEVKQELAAALEDRFRRPRERYCDLLASLPALQGILATGAERARAQARPILDQVRRAAGMGVGWSALESARTG